MKYLASLLAALLISGCAVVSNFTKGEDFTQLRDATVQVVMPGKGSCSGVKIAHNTVLTAAHCVPIKETVVAGVTIRELGDMFVDGQEVMAARVGDGPVDVAVLIVKAACPCVGVASERPAVDTPVVVIGYPLGLAQFLTEGRLQPDYLPYGLPEEFREALAHLMPITAQVAPGNSGGPVFAKVEGRWQVIGTVSGVGVAAVGGFIPNLMTHVVFVVNTETLAALLRGLRL